jgi:hypothetical protein
MSIRRVIKSNPHEISTVYPCGLDFRRSIVALWDVDHGPSILDRRVTDRRAGNEYGFRSALTPANSEGAGWQYSACSPTQAVTDALADGWDVFEFDTLLDLILWMRDERVLGEPTKSKPKSEPESQE